MKLIILCGKSNSGKTSTLRMLIEKITSSADGSFVCKSDEVRFNKHNEITVPLIYKGVLIAITTYGDSVPDIKYPFENYKDFAKIFICASHPEGSEPYNFLNNYEFSKDCLINKEKVEKESDYSENNRQSADFLFEKLNKIIKSNFA